MPLRPLSRRSPGTGAGWRIRPYAISRRRPLTLVRHVNGVTFFHEGPLPPVPAGVHELRIRKGGGEEGTRLWVDSLEGLLGLVTMGVVEVHPWGATVDDIEVPDTLVFDLDPGEGVEWDFVIETALRLRDLLSSEGLEAVAEGDRWQRASRHGACRPGHELAGREGLHPGPCRAGRGNCTRPLHDLGRAREAPRTAIHRLPAQRARHDGGGGLLAARSARLPDRGASHMARR